MEIQFSTWMKRVWRRFTASKLDYVCKARILRNRVYCNPWPEQTRRVLTINHTPFFDHCSCGMKNGGITSKTRSGMGLPPIRNLSRSFSRTVQFGVLPLWPMSQYQMSTVSGFASSCYWKAGVRVILNRSRSARAWCVQYCKYLLRRSGTKGSMSGFTEISRWTFYRTNSVAKWCHESTWYQLYVAHT